MYVCVCVCVCVYMLYIYMYICTCYKQNVFTNDIYLIQNQTKSNYIYLIYTYKEDSALNNQQGLVCHKTIPNQIIYI